VINDGIEAARRDYLGAPTLALGREMPQQVRLAVRGSEISGQVGMPRVPCVGELISGSDGLGPWRVCSVHYAYADGFAFAPTQVVVECE
jgi:hypothetical protein